MKKWKMRTDIYIGSDSLKHLETIKNKKVCMVCDPFLTESDAMQKIKSHFDASNEIRVYSDVVPDPPLEKVTSGIIEMAKFDPDLLIGIGGGSAIDQAKAISFFYQKINPVNKNVGCIAIPTTSGTGSEVTDIFVLSDLKEQKKYPVVDASVAPDIAILDETLVVSCPPSVTAYSGLDALTHALEALVAVDASHYTDALAQKAINLIFANLKKCFNESNNLEARGNMHQASCLAGIAFNNAGLGVCHAIAHQMGALLDLPHGLTNALLLVHVIEYNAQDENIKRKYAEAAKMAGIVSNGISDTIAVQKLIKEIKSLMKEVDCPYTLKQAGINKEDAKQILEKIIEGAIIDITFKSNPVKVREEDIKTIYLKTF